MARGGLKRLSAELRKELGAVVAAAAGLIEDEAKGLIMAGSSSGRETKKHLHEPSRPGEPPNNDRGTLHGNIETVMKEPLTAEVSSNASYAAALEYGTSKMAARPYMAPAVEATRRRARELLARGVARAVRKSGEQ